MKEKNENYWLLEAPVSKAIWHMAIPMMLGMSVNIIYNLTDTFSSASCRIQPPWRPSPCCCLSPRF